MRTVGIGRKGALLVADKGSELIFECPPGEVIGTVDTISLEPKSGSNLDVDSAIKNKDKGLIAGSVKLSKLREQDPREAKAYEIIGPNIITIATFETKQPEEFDPIARVVEIKIS